MSEEKKYISNKLRRYRRLSGYKQREVAKLLGLKSATRLTKWEKGKIFSKCS
ncbi:MAG: helix-turn-helix domain-containing protein [Bacteroidetes bacterium]|nr:helix-turn-helix domain-containing protein [Bacteroidota bacterium]